jgi:hypothetical protein
VSFSPGDPNTSFEFLFEETDMQRMAFFLCSLVLFGCDSGGSGPGGTAPLGLAAAAPGVPDANFGLGGAVGRSAIGAARSVVVDSTFIYVGGSDASGAGSAWRIEKRRISDGGLDPAFGTGGVVTSNPTGTNDHLLCLARESDALYAAGMDGTGNGRWRIEKRRSSDGSLVTGFGTGGIVAVDATSDWDCVTSLIVRGACLFACGVQGTSWRLEKRFLSDGALDPSFGAGGGVTSTIQPTVNISTAGSLAADDAWLYLVGLDPHSAIQGRIEKRSPLTGGLDPSFGAGGIVTTDGTDYSVVCHGSDLWLAGVSSAVEWKVERRRASDGALVPDFGTQGVALANPLGSGDWPNALVHDGTSLFVAGSSVYQSTNGTQWRIEKRDPASGALDPAFGTGGVLLEDLSHGDDYALGLAADASRIYVVGLEGSGYWRIEERTK